MNLQLILTHVALVLGFLLAALTIAHVIIHHRSPSGTIAWLAVIITVPYVGVPLYILFSGRKLKRRAGRKADIRWPECETLPRSRTSIIDRLLRKYEIPGATMYNRFKLCKHGEDAYRDMVEIIESAKHSIYVTMFILSGDGVGRDIVERLARKAAQGVKVRVLLDAVGSLKTNRRLLAVLSEAGAGYEYFMPVLRIPLRSRIHLRNHRKLVLVDEQRVMAGGANIADEYLGPGSGDERWKDIWFVLEGPAARYYAEVFRYDWEFASGEKLYLNPGLAGSMDNSETGAVVQVVPSGPDVPGDPLYAAMLQAMYEARERLWIITPYFVPDENMTRAVSLAAHRGVDVRILVPERSNHRLPDLARAPILRQIQADGGKILLYTDGMMHAKAMLVDDDLAITGSANMDMLSMFLSYEVMLFIYSKPDVAAVEQWISGLMENCREGVENVGRSREFMEGVVRMMAPLL